MEGFVYVVNPPIIPKVVFGSSLERVTLPLKGPCLSSFMRKIQGDLFLSPGPTARVDERNLMELRWPSRKGYSAFVSKVSRLAGTATSSAANVNYYDLEPMKPFKKATKPFNVGETRDYKEGFLTPAPNAYPFHVPPRRMKISTAFGSKRRIFPAIPVICAPNNVSKCQKCEEIPLGDYWHDFGSNLDLCRPCMKRLIKQMKSCTVTDVERLYLQHTYKDYQLVRYCGFYHHHGGTLAAVQTLPTPIYKRKLKLKIIWPCF